MVNFIRPFLDDPFVGHLGTIITISFFTGVLLISVPAYRPSMSAKARGTEIGFTHGYFLFGPFYSYGPLRPDNVFLSTEIVPFAAAILTTITVIIILTIATSVYSEVMFEGYLPPEPQGKRAEDIYTPDELEPYTYFDFEREEWRTTKVVRPDNELTVKRYDRTSYPGPFDYLDRWKKFAGGFLRGGIAGSITAAVLVYGYASNSEFLLSSLL